MHLYTKLLILSCLLFFSTMSGSAQESSSSDKKKKIEGELVNFASYRTSEGIYFKATLKGLSKDARLILEKEVSGKEEAVFVDSKRAIAAKENMPLLYCFKDENPETKVERYRLRVIHFGKEGKAPTKVLGEKDFPDQLMSLNEEE